MISRLWRFPALLALALSVAAFADPPVKPAKVFGVQLLDAEGAFPCAATAASCRLVFQWTRHPTYNAATDSTWLLVRQTTPGALRIDSVLVTGTADTFAIARGASGATKTGFGRLCFARMFYPGRVCNADLAWSMEFPVTPPDTAPTFTVRPISFSLPAGGRLTFTASGLPL